MVRRDGWFKGRVLGLLLLTGAVLLAGCASDGERIQELERENLDLIAERDHQRQLYADAASQLEASKKQGSATARELASAEQQRDQAIGTARDYSEKYDDALSALEASRQEAETRPVMDERAALEDIARRYRNQDRSRSVEIDENGNIEITLESDVTFGSGKVDLTTKGKQSVRSVEALLTGRYGDFKVRVEGHTDSEKLKKVKTLYEDNFGLGSRRALSVVRFLESDMGIDPTRLVSASRGEHEPVASNKTATGRSQNRRVEIVVVIPRDEAIGMASIQSK